MLKLKKADFDEKHRFREAREEGLVNCVSCATMTDGTNTQEGPAYCEHEERLKRIKLGEYWSGFWGEPGESHNIASKMVCDGYQSKPLPEGVVVPELPRKHAILLETQWRDPYHGDPNCPYVIEELRIRHEDGKVRGRTGGVDIVDNRDRVTGDTIRDICEMPCCESKLPYQVLNRPNDYRRRVGIKPDGTEEKVWVRNGIVKHEKKVNMSLEEAESVFDLEGFNHINARSVHDKIVAVSNHLHKYCNSLGSRPLSKAANPVWLNSSNFHILKDSSVDDLGADIWVYDNRLFNVEKGLEKPLSELKKIPEGLIPCMDTEGAFSEAERGCFGYNFSPSFSFYGVIKKLEERVLISKGLNRFLEIGAVHVSGYEHMWGEFGKGFGAIESFHEQ